MQVHIVLMLTIVTIATALEGPPQAPTFNEDETKKITREVFKEYEDQIAHEYNGYLPKKSTRDIRIMTWNTHMLLDLEEKVPVMDENLNVIRDVNPDILILQEIPLETTQRYKIFANGLKTLGFKNIIYQRSDEADAILGIIIASKQPVEFRDKLDLGSLRIALAVNVEMNEESLLVLGTHLEVTDGKIREQQLNKILNFIEGKKNVILAGDFNSLWKSDCMKPLKSSKHMHEIFRTVGWAHPEYTCWSGAEIDYIWIHESFKKRLSGAYVYHSSVSDHIPVVLDLKHNCESHAADSKGDFKLASLIIFLLIFICALAYRLLPADAWQNSYHALRDYDNFD